MKIGSPEQDVGGIIESCKVDHHRDENVNGYAGESIKRHITLWLVSNIKVKSLYSFSDRRKISSCS